MYPLPCAGLSSWYASSNACLLTLGTSLKSWSLYDERITHDELAKELVPTRFHLFFCMLVLCGSSSLTQAFSITHWPSTLPQNALQHICNTVHTLLVLVSCGLGCPLFNYWIFVTWDPGISFQWNISVCMNIVVLHISQMLFASVWAFLPGQIVILVVLKLEYVEKFHSFSQKVNSHSYLMCVQTESVWCVYVRKVGVESWG